MNPVLRTVRKLATSMLVPNMPKNVIVATLWRQDPAQLLQQIAT